jgi:hypothetical protein
MRKPDFIVGDERDPYLLRWHVIPRNRVFNIYLHKFLRDDDDRVMHDHPYISLSLIIKGSYVECTPGTNGWTKRKTCKRWSLIFRRAVHRHRIELIEKSPAWTIFITGPRIRDWGFWVNNWRFVGWKEFTDPKNRGKINKELKL